MPNQPNTDKSNRAQRRRAERNPVRALPPQPVAPPRAGGIPINLQELLAKIGLLTVERDFWQNKATQLEGQFQRLAEIQLSREEAETSEEETPQESGDSEEQPSE